LGPKALERTPQPLKALANSLGPAKSHDLVGEIDIFHSPAGTDPSLRLNMSTSDFVRPPGSVLPRRMRETSHKVIDFPQRF